MSRELTCWRCGASLKPIPKPLHRLAQCKACSADLHVCRQCQFYNPKLHTHCDHELAEPAREVDVANFCHYFRASNKTLAARDKTRSDAALANLQAMFGEPPAASSAPDTGKSTDTDKAKFDALFKKD